MSIDYGNFASNRKHYKKTIGATHLSILWNFTETKSMREGWHYWVLAICLGWGLCWENYKKCWIVIIQSYEISQGILTWEVMCVCMYVCVWVCVNMIKDWKEWMAYNQNVGDIYPMIFGFCSHEVERKSHEETAYIIIIPSYEWKIKRRIEEESKS